MLSKIQCILKGDKLHIDHDVKNTPASGGFTFLRTFPVDVLWLPRCERYSASHKPRVVGERRRPETLARLVKMTCFDYSVTVVCLPLNCELLFMQ